jgi:hypothetical protein
VSESRFNPREIRLLVGLADGSLPSELEEAAEREVLARPEGRAALERQRRAVAAVRGAAPPAPETLRRRIEALERKPRRARVLRRPALAGALAAAVLALLAVALLPGSGDDPAMAQVAALAERDISSPAPDSARGGVLAEEAEGIRYPDWRRQFGWNAEGARTDELAGRRAETVFYEHEGHHIGYTILAGDAVDPPPRSRRTVRNGVELHFYKDGPRDVVTFVRDGRTCVLSGEVLRRETLLELAAWKPGQPGSHNHSHS